MVHDLHKTLFSPLQSSIWMKESIRWSFRDYSWYFPASLQVHFVWNSFISEGKQTNFLIIWLFTLNVARNYLRFLFVNNYFVVLSSPSFFFLFLRSSYHDRVEQWGRQAGWRSIDMVCVFEFCGFRRFVCCSNRLALSLDVASFPPPSSITTDFSRDQILRKKFSSINNDLKEDIRLSVKIKFCLYKR